MRNKIEKGNKMKALILKTDSTIRYVEIYIQKFEKKMLQISELIF